MKYLLLILILSTFITHTLASDFVLVFFRDLDNFKEKNLLLLSERENLKASSDVLLSRKLFWTPKLSMSLVEDQTRLNRDKAIESKSAKADLSLNIWKGGSDWNRLNESKAQNKAQELKVLTSELNGEVKVADLIFKFLYLLEVKRIEEEVLKLKEESFKIVKDRFLQGKFPSQEVTKSEVDLSFQRNKLRGAKLNLIENQSLISSLFIEEIKTHSWPFSENTELKSTDSNGLNFPSVALKMWSANALFENWKSSKGMLSPSLDFQFEYLKYTNNNQASGLLTLTFPLWDQFSTSASISESKASYTQAFNDYKESSREASEKMRFLKEKVETSRINLIESRKTLEMTKKLYEDILKSFRLGRISINDLFLEQNRLLESENNLVIGQLTFHQGIMETCSLLGFRASECFITKPQSAVSFFL